MGILKIIYNNIYRRKVHTAISIFMLVIVTAVFFFSQQVVWGMRQGVDKGVDRLGADIIVLPQKMGSSVETMLFSPEPMNVYLNREIFQEVNAIAGIARSSPQFFAQTLNESCCSLGGTYRLVGFEQETDFVLQSWMAENLKRPLRDDEILIGADIPSFLGDKAVILDEAFSVAGRLHPTGSESLDNTIFMLIDKARQLAGDSPYLENIWDDGYTPEKLVSAVLIKVEDITSLSGIVNRLAELPGVQVNVMSNLARQAKGNILLIVKILYLFFGLIWLLSVIAVGNHFLTEVRRRKREIGVIRAVGGSPKKILLIFLLEAGALSLLGALLGLPLGYLLLKAGVSWLSTGSLLVFAPPTLTVTLMQAMVSMLLALGTGILAVSYPAVKASKIDPATAMSYGEME